MAAELARAGPDCLLDFEGPSAFCVPFGRVSEVIRNAESSLSAGGVGRRVPPTASEHNPTLVSSAMRRRHYIFAAACAVVMIFVYNVSSDQTHWSRKGRLYSHFGVDPAQIKVSSNTCPRRYYYPRYHFHAHAPLSLSQSLQTSMQTLKTAVNRNSAAVLDQTTIDEWVIDKHAQFKAWQDSTRRGSDVAAAATDRATLAPQP